MTNEQILKKAIEKAVKGGFYNEEIRFLKDDDWKVEDILYYAIIFSHSFAKAFWGEKFYEGYPRKIKINLDKYEYVVLRIWEHHLQQMVLEEEPLKYLERFLGEKSC